MKPKVLDLCCGAGGVSAGLVAAGFDVLGVDITHQPNYPYSFICSDALDFPLTGFDLVWVSPPCQGYSRMSNCRTGLADTYARLIDQFRDKVCGVPYVIENVEGAPLVDPIMLCGFMFGRDLYRHRLFESNLDLVQPEHPRHVKPSSKAGHWKSGTVISVAGHCSPMWLARQVMGINWMTREEMVEAIPPYMAEFVGRQVIKFL